MGSTATGRACPAPLALGCAKIGGPRPARASARVALHDVEHRLRVDVGGQGVKRCLVRERPFEPGVELVALDLDRAELPQMIGDELRVEQQEAAADQARAQIDERHLAGVALDGEHALAKVGAMQRYSVEAADQPPARPCLHGVAIASIIEVAVKRPDLAVDPGGAPAGLGRRTTVEHAFKIGIDPDLEDALADGTCKPLWHMHPVQRQDPALLWLDPIERGIIGALCHREDAAGIGLEEHLRRDLDNDVVARGHFASLGRNPTSPPTLSAGYGFCRYFSSQWMS